VAALAVLFVALGAGPSLAGEKTVGWGVVMARDVQAATLSIDGTIFRVTASTTFKDLDGQAVSFATLPVFDVHQGLFKLDDATKVEYTAQRTRDGQWVLESVEMIDRLPD
jgi:hypothetical protein